MDIIFDEKGLIPAIVQDHKNKEVLMLAYMNEEAVQKTMDTGFAHFYSRSRKKLWKKGETSGNLQRVISLDIDCDTDTILLKVEQTGVACHTGERTCFFNRLIEFKSTNTENEVMEKLYGIIKDRRANPKEGSYTNYLFNSGIDKILKKVGEETSEVIIASKGIEANKRNKEVTYEISDLVYHLLVLMVELDISPNEIREELGVRML